jgi:hypothetical protein
MASTSSSPPRKKTTKKPKKNKEKTEKKKARAFHYEIERFRAARRSATNDGAENAEENANVDGDAIDTVRVNKKSKHAEVPDETSGAVDVEAAKDAFVQQSAQLKHDALEIKEQTEATLDKLNEVHYELVKNTNALLSAVDPNLAAVIADTEQRITAVEEAAVRADCADAAKPDDSNLVVVATTTETAATDTEAPSQVATTADADTAAN